MVTEYLIEWTRDTSVGCSDEDTDSTTITDGSAVSHTIPGLEEVSRYTITVTATNGAGSSEVSTAVTAMTEEAGKVNFDFPTFCKAFKFMSFPLFYSSITSSWRDIIQ